MKRILIGILLLASQLIAKDPTGYEAGTNPIDSSGPGGSQIRPAFDTNTTDNLEQIPSSAPESHESTRVATTEATSSDKRQPVWSASVQQNVRAKKKQSLEEPQIIGR